SLTKDPAADTGRFPAARILVLYRAFRLPHGDLSHRRAFCAGEKCRFIGRLCLKNQTCGNDGKAEKYICNNILPHHKNRCPFHFLKKHKPLLTLPPAVMISLSQAKKNLRKRKGERSEEG